MLLATTVIAACDPADQASDDDAQDTDAGPTGGDGGSGPLAEIAGMWRWTLTPAGADVPELDCSVHLSADAFEVTCPGSGFPSVVETGCTQLREDAHVSGSVRDGLTGSVDQIVEYSGASCASHGYTTGAPYPTPPWAVMNAEHVLEIKLPALLPALGGRWVWTLSESLQPSARMGCSVELGVADGVAITIDCPTTVPKDVALACQEQEHLEIAATLVVAKLSGTITPVTRHTGAGCTSDYPPEERGDAATMTAEPVLTP